MALVVSRFSSNMSGEKAVAANPLEQFVLLAKTAKGIAAVELIKQALEAPGVYVFGELLDTANIQEVEFWHFQMQVLKGFEVMTNIYNS